MKFKVVSAVWVIICVCFLRNYTLDLADMRRGKLPQVIDAIRTYDFRLVRAITAFEEALNIPYVDSELIHMHARRLRLIGAALGGKIEWLIRFVEGKRPEGMEEYWNDMIGKDTM